MNTEVYMLILLKCYKYDILLEEKKIMVESGVKLKKNVDLDCRVEWEKARSEKIGEINTLAQLIKYVKIVGLKVHLGDKK